VRGPSEEIHYGGTATVAATERLTLVGELLGRRVGALGRVAEMGTPHPSIADMDTIRLAPENRRLTTVLALAGFKWNVREAWLFSGNLLFPLARIGLRARVVPAFGLAYSFGG
jgi:hypothetical protein